MKVEIGVDAVDRGTNHQGSFQVVTEFSLAINNSTKGIDITVNGCK